MNQPIYSLSLSPSPIKKKTNTLFASTNRYTAFEIDEQNKTEQRTIPYQDTPNSNTITLIPNQEKQIPLPLKGLSIL